MATALAGDEEVVEPRHGVVAAVGTRHRAGHPLADRPSSSRRRSLAAGTAPGYAPLTGRRDRDQRVGSPRGRAVLTRITPMATAPRAIQARRSARLGGAGGGEDERRCQRRGRGRQQSVVVEVGSIGGSCRSVVAGTVVAFTATPGRALCAAGAIQSTVIEVPASR